MLKFIKLLLGIALWPLTWAVSVSAYQLYNASAVDTLDGGLSTWALPIGFLVWVLLFFLLPRPFRTYVLGHELTHALWAMMMGARIGKMKVGKKGGHVELSKSNFIITLAPYFFPFYTAILITVYYLLSIWFDVEAHQVWWLAGIGLTWSFHITFTLHMLSQQQPDIQEHGRIFSYTLIYTMNVLVIVLLMVAVGSPRLLQYGDMLGHESARAYNHTAHYLRSVWHALRQMIPQ